MNKLVVILLAVCLISVNAYVKRDTNSASQGEIASIMQSNFKSLADGLQDQFSKAFDPEKIKKDFNSMIDTLNEAVNSLKPKAEAPQH